MAKQRDQKKKGTPSKFARSVHLSNGEEWTYKITKKGIGIKSPAGKLHSLSYDDKSPQFGPSDIKSYIENHLT